MKVVVPMSVLEAYKRRLGATGEPSRERWLRNTQSWINRKLPRSLSYYTAIIDGEERQCAILSTQDATEKKICSMPGESLVCGTYVEWMGSTWLITELDAQSEVYQSALMVQCNYVLKWVNGNGEIVSRWVNVIDGTKYLTGEYYNRAATPNMTVGDARLQLTMPYDDETVLLNRNQRFIIDLEDATEPQTFELSKINRTGKVFNGHGVFVHMLTESGFNPESDNIELGIADYYTRIGQFAVMFKNVTDTLSLKVGDSFDVDAVVVKNGTEQSNLPVSFSCSDESVATVSEDGVVTGVGEGRCSVAAQYLTFNKVVDVVVSDVQSAPYIIFDIPESVNTINVGASIVVTATKYEGVTMVEGAGLNGSVDCESGVVSLTSDGNQFTLTASRDRKNIGKVVTLTVSDGGGCEASRTFKVRGWS